MPRSNRKSRYLPLRFAPSTRRPFERRSNSATGWRRTVRDPVTFTFRIVEPTTAFSIPRRTVSTSGSSGIARNRRSDCRERRGRRRLLGAALRVPFASNDVLDDPHDGAYRRAWSGPSSRSSYCGASRPSRVTVPAAGSSGRRAPRAPRPRRSRPPRVKGRNWTSTRSH